MSANDLYSTHASLIESVLAASCRAHRLAPDHADEFRSWARLRLLDDECAVLRKFAGRSSLRTFLVTVVERLYLDWRNHEWGKWRPSSEARRLGELAVELERLALRDRCTFDEAAGTLVARGLARSVADCERVWIRLPRMPRRQRVDEAALVGVPAPAGTSDALEADERRARARQVVDALERAVASLPPSDQSIVRLRYWGRVKVSRIAVMVGEEQKALYRQFERLWADLRLRLESEGVTGAELQEIFDGWDPDPAEEDDGGS